MQETIKNALSQLLGNKLRTFLTMLGMLIGISAVIIILSLGEGVKGYVSGEFASVGKGTVTIAANEYKDENMITKDDLLLLEEIPEVTSTMNLHQQYMGSASNYNNDVKTLMFFGITYNYEDFTSLNLQYGRSFTEEDESLRNNVMIVEDNFAKVMYGVSDPKYALGKSYEINIGGEKQTFEIVGITKSEYPAMTPEEFIMPIVFMPFTTADHYLCFDGGKSYIAYAIIDDAYEAADYTYMIKRLLEKKHGKEDLFTVSTMVEQVEGFNKVLNTLNLFVSLVAAVSLLVGGIGIMNIMLVTVRERTREIGIRKALGATDKQILMQFLVEALILTLLGGIAGLIIGYIGALMLASLVHVVAKITVGMIVFSVGTSSVIGIIFGVYPAYKAAKMDPIEALRIE